jgi:hypothetical protein
MSRRPWNKRVPQAQRDAEEAALDQTFEQNEKDSAQLRLDVFADTMTHIAAELAPSTPTQPSEPLGPVEITGQLLTVAQAM